MENRSFLIKSFLFLNNLNTKQDEQKKLQSILVYSVIFLGVLFFTCGEDPVNAPQDFVSGTITYTDTLLNYNGGYYAISIYGDSTNPFSHPPVRTDSITPTIQN